MPKSNSITRFLIALGVCVLLSSPSQAQQTVRVGVASFGAPFSFHDEATNTDQGLMVDLINEIAKTSDLKLQLQSLAISALIQSLTNGSVDLVVGTLAVTADRKAQIAFSQIVYSDSDALIVPRSDATKYTSYEDLKGKILGLQNGIVPLKSLKTALYPKIRIYDGGPDVLRALAAGEIEVGVANRSISGYQLKIGAFPTLQLVPTFKPTNFGDIAFGLRKDNARLVSTVDSGLAKAQAAGTLKTILEKWGVQ